MKTFAWVLRSEVEAGLRKDAALVGAYAQAIRPCADGWEHACQTHHAMDFTKHDLGATYNLKDARFVGTLVILEELGTLHVPLTAAARPKRRRGAAAAYLEEAQYNAIVDSNVRVCDGLVQALRACEEAHLGYTPAHSPSTLRRTTPTQTPTAPTTTTPATHTPPPYAYVVMKVGLRHHRRMFVDDRGTPQFGRGHANVVVFSTRARYAFHMEPSLHDKVAEVADLLVKWWGTVIAPRLGSRARPWTLASNVWFHGMEEGLRLFPQQCPHLCRAWVWIMALSVVANRVGSAEAFLSVLNILTRFRVHLLKIFLLFHMLLQPRPPPCSAACHLRGRLRWVSEELHRIRLHLIPRVVFLRPRNMQTRARLRVSRSAHPKVFLAYYDAGGGGG